MFASAVGLGWVVLLTTWSTKRVRQAVAAFLASPLCRAIGLDVRVHGLQRLERLGPSVYIANHQSHVDQAILANLYRRVDHLAIVAKLYGVWNAPPLAALFERTGNIVLRAGRLGRNAQALRFAASILGRGISVALYPEGTRQRDGRYLAPFNMGAFIIAIRSGVPIVPVVVSRHLPDIDLSEWRVMPHVSHIRVLEPVPTQGLTRADAGRLRDEVREKMQRVLDRDEAEGPGPV